jgi:hypothetical protein
LAFTLIALSVISFLLSLDVMNANGLGAVSANALPQNQAGSAYVLVDRQPTRPQDGPRAAPLLQEGRAADDGGESWSPREDHHLADIDRSDTPFSARRDYDRDGC